MILLDGLRFYATRNYVSNFHQKLYPTSVQQKSMGEIKNYRKILVNFQITLLDTELSAPFLQLISSIASVLVSIGWLLVDSAYSLMLVSVRYAHIQIRFMYVCIFQLLSCMCTSWKCWIFHTVDNINLFFSFIRSYLSSVINLTELWHVKSSDIWSCGELYVHEYTCYCSHNNYFLRCVYIPYCLFFHR